MVVFPTQGYGLPLSRLTWISLKKGKRGAGAATSAGVRGVLANLLFHTLPKDGEFLAFDRDNENVQPEQF